MRSKDTKQVTSNHSQDLSNDPRWQAIHDRDWTCHCCGNTFSGLPDLGAPAPDYWTEDTPPGPNTLATTSTHFLSEDFCVLDGEHFFIRCVLNLPIIGGNGAEFSYGVWSSLSEASFKHYLSGFNSEQYEDWGPWFGWFSNDLKGYPETLLLKCQVHPRKGRNRPVIELEESDHPLALEFHNGVSFDRVLELCAINGHTLQPMPTNEQS